MFEIHTTNAARSSTITSEAAEGNSHRFIEGNLTNTGTLTIEYSKLRDNPNAGFHTAGYPGIFFLGHSHPRIVSSSLS